MPAFLARDTILRYEAMRQVAREDAEALLRERWGTPELRLSGIDWQALGCWARQWKPVPGRDGGFDWRTEAGHLMCKYKRFELALWHGDALCGLAVGKPSPAKRYLRIHLLEGNPDNHHPLRGRVAASVVEAAGAYAWLLGSEQLQIMKPLPRALRSYRRLCFQLPHGFMYPPDPNAVDEALEPPYCYRDL